MGQREAATREKGTKCVKNGHCCCVKGFAVCWLPINYGGYSDLLYIGHMILRPSILRLFVIAALLWLTQTVL